VFGSIGVAEIYGVTNCRFQKSVAMGPQACGEAKSCTHMRYAQEPPHEAIVHSADIEYSEIDLARDVQRTHDRGRDVLGPWVARIQGRS